MAVTEFKTLTGQPVKVKVEALEMARRNFQDDSAKVELDTMCQDLLDDSDMSDA